MESVVCLDGQSVVAIRDLDLRMCSTQVEENQVEDLGEASKEQSLRLKQVESENGVLGAAADSAVLKRKMDGLEPPKKKLCKSLRAAAMPSSNRCGSCHTCLNPKLNKPCQVVREQQQTQEGLERAASAAKDEEAVEAPSVKGLPPASSVENPQRNDLFKQQLDPLLARNGGLSDAKHVTKFEQIMANELRWHVRVMLCVIIMRSQQPCLEKLVAGTALKTLERWLNDANESFKEGRDLRYVLQILETLAVLPINLELLKQGTVGQTVGRLRKHDSLEVKTAASDLVDNWKKLVDKTYQGKPARSDARKEDSLRKGRSDTAKVDGGPTHARKNSAELGKGISVEITIQNAIMDDELVVQSAPARKVVRAPPRKLDLNKGPSASTPTVTPSSKPQNPAPAMQSQSSDTKSDSEHSKPEPEQTKPEPADTINGPSMATPFSVPYDSAQTDGLDTNGKSAPVPMDDTPDGPFESIPERDNSVDNECQAGPGPPTRATTSNTSEPAASSNAASAALTQGVAVNAEPIANGQHADAGQPNSNLPATHTTDTAATDCTNGPQPSTSTDNKASTNITAAAVHTAPPTENGTSATDHKPTGNAASHSGAAHNASPTPGTSSAVPTANRTASSSQGTAARLGSLLSGSGTSTSSLLTALGNSTGRLGGVSAGSSHKSVGATSAATRAMQAAENVKLEPEMLLPRKPKTKKVSWIMDEGLVRVRYFRKDDPVINVKEDAIMTADELAQSNPVDTAVVAVPPGFEFAARREHQDERQALQAQHQQEEQDKQDLMDRLGQMNAGLPWSEPPRCQPDPSWLVASGEDSMEKAERSKHVAMVPAARYPSTYHIPPSPYEPMQPQPDPDPNLVPRIPLSVPGQLLQQQQQQQAAAAGATQLQLGQAAAIPMATSQQLPQVIHVAGMPGQQQVFQNLQGQPLAMVAQGQMQTIFQPLLLSSLTPQGTMATQQTMQQHNPGAGSAQILQNKLPGINLGLADNASNRPGSLFSDGPQNQEAVDASGEYYRRGGDYHSRGSSRERSRDGRGAASRHTEFVGGRSGRREEETRFGEKSHKRRICAFFTQPQGCRNGDRCHFLHLTREEELEMGGTTIPPPRGRPTHIGRDERDQDWENSGRGGRSGSRNTWR